MHCLTVVSSPWRTVTKCLITFIVYAGRKWHVSDGQMVHRMEVGFLPYVDMGKTRAGHSFIIRHKGWEWHRAGVYNGIQLTPRHAKNQFLE